MARIGANHIRCLVGLAGYTRTMALHIVAQGLLRADQYRNTAVSTVRGFQTRSPPLRGGGGTSQLSLDGRPREGKVAVIHCGPNQKDSPAEILFVTQCAVVQKWYLSG